MLDPNIHPPGGIGNPQRRSNMRGGVRVGGKRRREELAARDVIHSSQHRREAGRPLDTLPFLVSRVRSSATSCCNRQRRRPIKISLGPPGEPRVNVRLGGVKFVRVYRDDVTRGRRNMKSETTNRSSSLSLELCLSFCSCSSRPASPIAPRPCLVPRSE